MASASRVYSTFRSFFFIQKRTFSAPIKDLQTDVSVQHLQKDNLGISVLSLNRQKQKNALSFSLVHDINEALNNLTDTRVLIIKSSIPNVFCAGNLN